MFYFFWVVRSVCCVCQVCFLLLGMCSVLFFSCCFFARAVVKVLNGAAARLYFSGPGIKLKPVRKKVHSENKKWVSKKNPLVAD